eukprot:14824442-Alexandrium_andersonii.AAC.1
MQPEPAREAAFCNFERQRTFQGAQRADLARGHREAHTTQTQQIISSSLALCLQLPSPVEIELA